MITKRVFWEYGTHYVHHHKDEKWTPASVGPTFHLEETDWAELKKIMDTRKVQVSDSLWKADRPFMLRQVRMEIANTTMGPLERYKILVEEDSQLKQALELFPRASKLMTQAVEAKPKSHP
jgi:hypothetical protein